MNASLHPLPTKLAAALMAAGLATTGVFGEAPGGRDEVASLTAEVANASAVTDLLYTAGDAVARASYGIAVAADGAISLPFDIAAALVAGSRAPSIAPSLVSWLVQRYANPSDDYGFSWDSLAWRIKTYSLEPLAALLPQPLSDTVVNLIDAIANGFGDALERILPDPTAGLLATEAFWGTPIGRTMVGVNDVLAAPVWMAWDTAVYLGYLPAELEATFEAALRDPSEIPGLLSNLAYRLLGSGGLLGSLIVEIAAPLEAFPGPIGKLAADVMWGVYDALDAVLSVLPTPIPPVPFATAAPTADTEAVEGASQHGPEVAPKVLATDQTQLIAVDVPTEDERAADEVADVVDEGVTMLRRLPTTRRTHRCSASCCSASTSRRATSSSRAVRPGIPQRTPAARRPRPGPAMTVHPRARMLTTMKPVPVQAIRRNPPARRPERRLTS